MNNKTIIVVIAILGLIAGIGAALWYQQRTVTTTTAKTTPAATEPIIGKPRPGFKLLDLQGKEHDIAEWDGKVVLINFWATWCPPCVKEMPALMQLRETYQSRGFEIVGVALDNKDAVINFIDPLGIEYPILLAEQEGIPLAQQYGDRLGILPYTVIIDRNGIVRHVIISELTYEATEKLLLPLL